MSSEDGLVMQLHAGSVRNHDNSAYRRFGLDAGVVGEAMVALILAGECLAKFGGDSLEDFLAGHKHYMRRLKNF